MMREEGVGVDGDRDGEGGREGGWESIHVTVVSNS